jgi:hypothetical protein
MKALRVMIGWPVFLLAIFWLTSMRVYHQTGNATFEPFFHAVFLFIALPGLVYLLLGDEQQRRVAANKMAYFLLSWDPRSLDLRVEGGDNSTSGSSPEGLNIRGCAAKFQQLVVGCFAGASAPARKFSSSGSSPIWFRFARFYTSPRSPL